MDNLAQPESTSTVRKSNRFLRAATALIVLLIVAAAGMYTWYSVYRPCKVDAVEQASTRLITQLNFYDRVYQVTTNASRTSLVRPVAALQQIVMDTQQITVPVCMQTAKNELVNYMGTVIRAFLAYGAGEPNAAVQELINQSDAHYSNFSTELEAVKECAPFCFP